MEGNIDVDYRISEVTGSFMLFVAYIVYIVNFVINILGDEWGVGEVLSFIFMAFSYACFAAWFTFEGASPFEQTGTLVKYVLSWIISMIPVLNVFYFEVPESGILQPGIVANVSKMIKESRKQDEVNATESGSRALERESRQQDMQSREIVEEEESPERYSRPNYRQGQQKLGSNVGEAENQQEQSRSRSNNNTRIQSSSASSSGSRTPPVLKR
jgi:hypothetical protein